MHGKRLTSLAMKDSSSNHNYHSLHLSEENETFKFMFCVQNQSVIFIFYH